MDNTLTSFDPTSSNSVTEYNPNDIFDSHTDVVSTITGGAVASVADFASSIWNTLTPQKLNTTTEDILSRVSDNALNIYNENPDTIHAISFIGGSLIPAGLALKGLTALRMGAKGISWFSEAGKVSQLAKIDEAFQAGMVESAEYKSAIRTLYAQGIANAVVDNAAMELAILGTMSSHPWMEDYYKDPIQNFSISMLYGTTIGGVINRIGLGKEVKDIGISAWTKAVDVLQKDTQGVKITDNLSTQIARRQVNIDNWQATLDRADDLKLNPLTKEVIQFAITDNKAAMIDGFDLMAKAASKPNMVSLPVEIKQAVIEHMNNNPAMFAGADAIKYFEAEEVQKTIGSKILGIFQSNTKVGEDLPLVKTVTDRYGNEVIKSHTAVFTPNFGGDAGGIVNKNDMRSLGLAVDIPGITENTITKGIPKGYYDLPRFEKDLEATLETSSARDKDFLQALAYIDKIPDNEISRLATTPDDLATLNAISVRMSKLPPELKDSIKVTITKNRPNWGAVEERILAPIIAEGKGVKASYLSDIKKFTTGSAYDAFNIQSKDSGLTANARDMLSRWKAGSNAGVKNIRDSVEEYFRGGGYGARIGVDTSAVGSIYNSKNSVALRNEFLKNADSDGNVYLYRGMRKKAFGSSAVESFTTLPEKAKEFGDVRLYKVKVQDILGGMLDIASRDGIRKNEILVLSPTRDALAHPPVAVAGKEVTQQEVNNLVTNTATPNAQTYDHAGVVQTLLEAKSSSINELLQQGVPFESISIRTNTPIEAVERYALSPEKNATTLGAFGGWSSYTDPAMISEYLSPAKRSIELSTNMNKVPGALIKASLDSNTTENIDQLTQLALLSRSDSSIIHSIVDYLNDANTSTLHERLREGLSNIVNPALGNKFLQSTDFALRGMGDIAAVVSALGKDITHLKTTAIDDLVKPISGKLATIIKTPALTIEANTAYQVQAALDGYISYKEGKFFVQNKDDPWITKVLADGRKIKERNMVQATFNNAPYQIVSPEVRDFFEHAQKVSGEMYSMRNAINSILGRPPISDRGFWMPAFNPRDKFITYVHDINNDSTKLLYGRTLEEMETAKKMYASQFPDGVKGMEREHQVFIDKGIDQEMWNKLAGRHDEMFMSVADASSFHTGSSALARVPTNTQIFSEIVGGYEHYIGKSIANTLELSLYDIMDHLNSLSKMSQKGYKGQPLSDILKDLNQPKDVGAVIRNTLLGNSNLNQSQWWGSLQNGFQTAAERGIQVVSSIMSPILQEVGKGKIRSDAEWSRVVAEMYARGITNPLQAFADETARQYYHVDKYTSIPGMTPRLVALSNSLAATSILKVLELAQPIVNAISLPILTSGALARNMDKTFMNYALNPTARLGTIETMFSGMRLAFGKEGRKYINMAEKRNLFQPIVSEVNAIQDLTKGLDTGAVAAMEKAVNSKLVDILSKPADYSETLVRRISFATGIQAAKKAYPGIGDEAAFTFARDFMDRAVGNFATAQRPTMFQGTLGVAMGLFQTYMVTFAQQIYGHLELKNYKAISKMMLMQTGIFGAQSLPGFHQVSELIGEHFSDQNIDLETGMYRALPNEAADLLLYGLPSNLGPAVTTRGDIQPRLPNPFTGLDSLAAVNMLKQGFQLGGNVLRAATTADASTGKAIAEALSLQSISRPVARISELITGHSVNSASNVIASPDEVYTTTGIASRILSTRPLEEVKAREAMHLNSLYRTLDRDARDAAINKLATHVRDGNLNETILEKTMEEYMRTGSPTGWRMAVNKVMSQSQQPGISSVRNYMAPNIPAQRMIEGMD